MSSVTISTKHQIAVPSEARDRPGLKAGDRPDVEIEGDVLHLRCHVPAGSQGRSVSCSDDDSTIGVGVLRVNGRQRMTRCYAPSTRQSPAVAISLWSTSGPKPQDLSRASRMTLRAVHGVDDEVRAL